MHASTRTTLAAANAAAGRERERTNRYAALSDTTNVAFHVRLTEDKALPERSSEHKCVFHVVKENAWDSQRDVIPRLSAIYPGNEPAGEYIGAFIAFVWSLGARDNQGTAEVTCFQIQSIRS